MLRIATLGPAVRLTLDRPEVGNSLDAALVAALADAVREAAPAPALVLEGAGDAFCRGLDLTALSECPHDTSTYRAFAGILSGLADYRGLTIALVDGEAYGGGLALASSCDVVVATARASFGLPEALWGLLPALAAPSIARRAGHAATRRLALTAEPQDAAEALRLGLVDVLAEDGRAAESTARRLGLRVSRIGVEGLAAVKAQFRRLEDDPQGYGAWALAEISARSAAPETRDRVAKLLQMQDNADGR